MTKTLFASLVAICFVGLSAERASAQDAAATFMLVPGIPGDSSTEGYVGWIAVSSFAHAFNPIEKTDNVCSLSITKRLDSAGPRLWAAAVTEQLFNRIQVDIVRPGGDGLVKIYEILLVNARVVSIMTSGSSDPPHDQVTITAESVGLKFIRQNPDGSVGPAITTSFSCK